ncbi:MAG: DsbA family oxidoreductase [Deltaproteobacteria bacterium]|nr:DsbA family oxidoreductase [Deltaproteobacteria bacterium]
MELKIEVFSDIVCPWCYVGKRRLDAALKSFDSRIPVSVTWKAFQLNPKLPTEGVAWAEYMHQKFGAQRVQEMNANLTELGKEDGINFRFDKIQRSPNTFQAHRLNWLARQEGQQDEVVEAVFRAYFSEGKDIGEIQTLMKIGAACGIPLQRLQRFFGSSEGVSEVQAEVQEAVARDISMVPHFVMNKEYWISGADTIETFSNACRVAAQASA